MLKSLQRNFLILTMALLAIVLFGAYAFSYTMTQQQLNRFVTASLDRVLDTTTPTRPYIGVLTASSDGSDQHSYGQMAVFWVDIDSSGKYSSNDTAAIIGPRALSAVLNVARDSTEDMGYLPDYDIVWKRGALPHGTRIAIANTTGVGAASSAQLNVNIMVGLGALAVLAVIMWRISCWIVRPVQLSWQAQRQFTADASHELKTPLAVILANSRILKGDLPKIPEEDHRWILSTDTEAERMRGLVTNLLELSRADENHFTGGSIYRHEDMDLSELVEGMTMQFDVVAFESGCMIDEHIDPDIHVIGDAQETEKVVKILLDNAVKYSHKGNSVDVTVARDGSRNRARVSVRNFGEALDPNDVAHIFDRFFRTDKARSRSTGGYGLGLPIAKAIIEGQGGTIKCESSAEGGHGLLVYPASRLRRRRPWSLTSPQALPLTTTSPPWQPPKSYPGSPGEALPLACWTWMPSLPRWNSWTTLNGAASRSLWAAIRTGAAWYLPPATRHAPLECTRPWPALKLSAYAPRPFGPRGATGATGK